MLPAFAKVVTGIMLPALLSKVNDMKGILVQDVESGVAMQNGAIAGALALVFYILRKEGLPIL